MNDFITIFTPTYNRKDKIKVLYESLRAQTCKNFEWIVVDDGSEDMTDKFFESLNETRFCISYFKVKNRGKHCAINYGVKKAKGNYFFIVDSDDSLSEDAVAVIYEWIVALPPDFAGVSGLRGSDLSTPMGDLSFFAGKPFVDATNIERKQKCPIWDMAEIYKTDILKRYSFPEFQGEKFLSEGAVWNKIASEGYKIRWYNRIIYKCVYLDDGLTMQGKKKLHDSPQGYGLITWQELHYFDHSAKEKLVICYEFYLDLCDLFSIKQIAHFLNMNYYKMILIVSLFTLRKKISRNK